jgi:hypothetical protein
MTCTQNGEIDSSPVPLIDINLLRPLIVGTILKRNSDSYSPVQTITLYNNANNAGFLTAELKDVKIDDKFLDFLKPIDIEGSIKETKLTEMYVTVPGMINKIYCDYIGVGKFSEDAIRTFLNHDRVKELSGKINAIIHEWKAPEPPSASCAIAGGRRRPKKSRRSRSSRKRRQTRSK